MGGWCEAWERDCTQFAIENGRDRAGSQNIFCVMQRSSLVPRPSPAPVLDHLQYAITEQSKTGAREGLGTRLAKKRTKLILTLTLKGVNSLQESGA